MNLMDVVREHLNRKSECQVQGSTARQHLGFTTVRRKVIGEYVVDVLPATLSVCGLPCSVTYDQQSDIFTIKRKA